MINRQRQRGLTLIELILASAIFAVMAVMAYAGLAGVANQREDVDQHREHLRLLQNTYGWLQRDLTQMINRPIQDGLGGEIPAVQGGGLNDWLSFSRTGYPNPAEQLRSHLIRVNYAVEEQQLIRRYWPMIQQVADNPPLEAVLLEDINSLELTFYGENDETTQQWPPLNLGDDDPVLLPRAIEIRFTDPYLGPVRWLFEVAA